MAFPAFQSGETLSHHSDTWSQQQRLSGDQITHHSLIKLHQTAPSHNFNPKSPPQWCQRLIIDHDWLCQECVSMRVSTMSPYRARAIDTQNNQKKLALINFIIELEHIQQCYVEQCDEVGLDNGMKHYCIGEKWTKWLFFQYPLLFTTTTPTPHPLHQH